MSISCLPRFLSSSTRSLCFFVFAVVATGVPASAQLVNGGSVSGVIVSAGQQDSYTFDATAGQAIQLRLVDVNLTSLVPKLRLLGPGGGVMENTWAGTVAAVNTAAPATGTYTVEVKDQFSTATGAYELHFVLVPGANEHGALINGGVRSETVGLGDLDSYVFTANAGDVIQLRMADLDKTALVPDIRLYGPSGGAANHTWGGSAAAITTVVSTTGTYTVVVGDRFNVTTGDYDLYFNRIPGANEGGALVNGALVAGTIDMGDLDSFTFVASVGDTYSLQVTGTTGTLIPQIWLYGPGGGGPPTTWGGTVSFNGVAGSSGTYTVVVGDSKLAETRDYNLFFSRNLEVYCTAGTTANGCNARLSAVGDASANSTTGFVLNAFDVEGDKDGLFFFGANGRQASPWGNGTSFQCVVPPVKRGGLLTGNGTPGACDGSFTQDLNALWCATCTKPGHNPGAGSTVQAQLWFRDPFNTSNQTTSLSDAIEFLVAP